MEKYGIENIKKVLDLGIEAGNVAGHWASPNGKGALELLRLTDEGAALLTVDYKLIASEITDVSDVENAELKAHAVQKFDIPQDKVEAAVEAGISIGLHVLAAVSDSFSLAAVLKT